MAAYAHTKEDILSFALLPHNGSCTRLKLTNETLSKRGLPNLVVAVVGDEAVGSYLTKHTLDAYIQKVYGADMGSANNIPRDALASHLLEGLSSAKLAVAGGLQGADASAIEKVERQVISTTLRVGFCRGAFPPHLPLMLVSEALTARPGSRT